MLVEYERTNDVELNEMLEKAGGLRNAIMDFVFEDKDGLAGANVQKVAAVAGKKYDFTEADAVFDFGRLLEYIDTGYAMMNRASRAEFVRKLFQK